MCLTGLNQVLKKSWEIANTSTLDEKTRLQELSLLNDGYKYRMPQTGFLALCIILLLMNQYRSGPKGSEVVNNTNPLVSDFEFEQADGFGLPDFYNSILATLDLLVRQ